MRAELYKSTDERLEEMGGPSVLARKVVRSLLEKLQFHPILRYSLESDFEIDPDQCVQGFGASETVEIQFRFAKDLYYLVEELSARGVQINASELGLVKVVFSMDAFVKIVLADAEKTSSEIEAISERVRVAS